MLDVFQEVTKDTENRKQLIWIKMEVEGHFQSMLVTIHTVLEEIYNVEYYIKQKYQKSVTKFSTLEN